MNNFDWCMKQNGGLELISPNQNLCDEYFKKAENALDALKKLEGNTEWQVSSAYYAMYFSLYALFMKIGVKSEIHKCTLTFMKKITYFSNEDVFLLKKNQTSLIKFFKLLFDFCALYKALSRIYFI